MAQGSEITLPKVVMERLLEVADYQRPYAWEAKQLTDLWEDLDLAGDKGHHYAGTLVLRQVDDTPQQSSSGESLSRFEVVDGQQRLTTCLLLLDRVRRALSAYSSSDEDVADAVRDLRRMYGQLKVDGVLVPRLRLGAGLNSYWADTVLGNEPTESTTLVAGAKRLRRATEFFDERIAALVEGIGPELATSRLLDLQGRVTSGLRFLVYEVESNAEVGVVFETLNERGRALSELEKVKNYLLYLARQLPANQSADLALKINEKWSTIFANLAPLHPRLEERLLRAHWLATNNPNSRDWRGVDSVKRKFPRSKYVPGSQRLVHTSSGEPDEAVFDELYRDVLAYVSTLSTCSSFMADLYGEGDPELPDYQSDGAAVDRARRATKALRRSPVVALYLPLVFGFRLRTDVDGGVYADLLELCEKYSARVFVICVRRSNAGEPYLCRLAHDVFEGLLTPEDGLREVGALLWRYAPDDDVREHLSGTHNWYDRAAHKFVLHEYERSLHKSDADVRGWGDFNDTGPRKTTEHILPQHPAKGSRWNKDFTAEERETLRHTLGNLMLTYDNSVYSNHDYAVKRGQAGQQTPCYLGPQALKQEVDVAQRYDEWTPASIKDRQKRIAEWAMKRWAVKTPDSDTAAEVDDAVEEETEQIPVGESIVIDETPL